MRQREEVLLPTIGEKRPDARKSKAWHRYSQ